MILELHSAPFSPCHHEIRARFFSSSMTDDLRYTPSDFFETFPFPESWETHPNLEEAGAAYDEFLTALMVENDEGITKCGQRRHDLLALRRRQIVHMRNKSRDHSL